jgi:Arylsulfotransferase (ASST)
LTLQVVAGYAQAYKFGAEELACIANCMSSKTNKSDQSMKITTKLVLATMIAVIAACAAEAEPSVVQTGVTVHDKARAYPCYVLYSGADGATHLIDMAGTEVHRWPHIGSPSRMLDPALAGGARGEVGLQLSALPANGTGLVPGMPAEFRNKTMGVVDWNDNVLWEWGAQAPGGAARQHHDWQRLPNGDTAMLVNISRVIPGFGQREMLDDAIYVVNPEGAIVWKWMVSEHLKEFGFTPAELALIRQSKEPDYFHTNDMFVLDRNRWDESGDKRFAPGNILINSRNGNVAVIIDRSTGHVVWRIGPDYSATRSLSFAPKIKTVPRPLDQISGEHDAYMIPEGRPGAGNILIFDNQGEAGFPPVPLQVVGGSRVIEIDPLEKTIVWEYSARNSGQADWQFYSPFISSAERLPNGNTLIDEGINGRFFQVTPEGDIVWEYISPVTGPAPMPPLPGRPLPKSNFTYRVQAVPYDWVPTGTPHTELP